MLTIRNEKLRGAIKVIVPFILIPSLAVLGAVVFDERRHIIISLCAAALSLLLFIAGFEKRTVGARRMVLTAVMTALCVAGRFIPFFKPVTALTVMTAMYLGSEAGFLTGALAALLSNFYFGQGPWTSFQMLAWGLIGFIAGALSEPLKRHRALLLLYGVLSGIAYSFIMDTWTVLWYNGDFSVPLYLVAIGTALPYTLLYAASNFIFLWFLAKPFGRKLERIRIKYGI